MAVRPKEPFSLWVMLREPGGPDREEFTACPGAAAFGSSSVAKLFQEGFFPKDLPCKLPRFLGRRRPALTVLLVSPPGCDGRS